MGAAPASTLVHAPFVRLGHGARDGHRRDHRYSAEDTSRGIAPKAQRPDASQHGIDHHAAQQPANQIAPEIPRDRFVPRDFGHRLPTGNLRPYFFVKPHQRVAMFRRSHQSDRAKQAWSRPWYTRWSSQK